MTFLMILGGLILLFAGGEALVSGSVSVARRLNISELVIGLTLVGFGTSVPELVTSLRAIGQDAVGIAVGNVVGSNIANILLVLGVAALIRPILTNPRALMRDGSFMVGVTLILCTLIYYDLFSRPVGIALVALLIVYMVYSVVADKGNTQTAALHEDEGESFGVQHGLGMGILLTALGIAGVVFGARFLVDGSVILARDFGISEAVIGLSIVAIGTSLPELATSAIAAFRGKSDVALGNILGSNIFNVLGIVGVTAIVHPFSVMREANAVEGDIAGNAMERTVIMESIISWEHIGALILSVMLLWLFAFSGRRVARWEGAVMLLAYALYMGMLFDLVPVPAILPNV
jgi:cation:H+ antiporter